MEETVAEHFHDRVDFCDQRKGVRSFTGLQPFGNHR